MSNSKQKPQSQDNARNVRVLNQGTENVYSDEAERTLIGTILTNGDMFDITVDYVRFSDFFTERHQYMWRAMEKLAASQVVINALTVRTELQKAGEQYWNAVGQAYLNQVATASDNAQNVIYYCKFIQRLALRRQVISHAIAIQTKAKDANVIEEELIAEAENNLLKLSQRLEVGSTMTMAQAVEAARHHIESAIAGNGLPVYKTGLIDLDERLMIVPKETYLFAARPKVGKSSLMLTIALNMAKAGTPVFYETTEGSMSIPKLMLRAISMETGIPYENLFRGNLTKEQSERYREALVSINKLPIVWDCTPQMTPLAWASKTKQNISRYGVEVAICDGIYTMTTGSQALDEVENRKAGAIIEQMTYHTGQLGIPSLITHQINRDAAKGKNKRPRKENLYYSGKFEQLVTAGVFIYRDVLENPNTERPNEAELIIDFYRDGGPGTVYCYFDPTRMKFMNGEKRRKITNIDEILGGRRHD